jgi:hypothetical protein
MFCYSEGSRFFPGLSFHAAFHRLSQLLAAGVRVSPHVQFGLLCGLPARAYPVRQRLREGRRLCNAVVPALASVVEDGMGCDAPVRLLLLGEMQVRCSVLVSLCVGRCASGMSIPGFALGRGVSPCCQVACVPSVVQDSLPFVLRRILLWCDCASSGVVPMGSALLFL